ncbi:hypothetical protein RCL_jg394.t1 [Rhizophagus clarus]|uniref:Myb-like domain-containing protein n=1 Tax=Rhizophagus clarus TaxID=94130 RepID=A0A8H3QYD6_9GLOM|nr:hypothetical protein RCL_jg394.t1 [Rhizophagus clarus]
MGRVLRKITKRDWLRDNIELVRNNNNNEQTTNTPFSKWLERSTCEELGIKYRKGRFTKQENEILYRALQEYKRRYDLNDDQLRDLMFYRNKKEHASFWKEIAAPLRVRSLKAVAQHIQRHHHEFNYRGSWSQEDDEQLKQLVQIYGRDWTTIGNQLRRMPAICRERFDIFLLHRDEYNRGRWSKEEEEQLIKIVVDISKQNNENVSLDWGIPWALVAEAMEYKRSELSCRSKWVKELRLRYELDEDRSARWTSYDSYMLCKRLEELNETDEYLIEWGNLADEEWGPWPHEFLCERWRHLKYTVNGFREKDFQEILYELLCRYKDKIPEKPIRPKSAPTINSEDDISSDDNDDNDNISNSDNDDNGDDRSDDDSDNHDSSDDDNDDSNDDSDDNSNNVSDNDNGDNVNVDNDSDDDSNNVSNDDNSMGNNDDDSNNCDDDSVANDMITSESDDDDDDDDGNKSNSNSDHNVSSDVDD